MLFLMDEIILGKNRNYHPFVLILLYLNFNKDYFLFENNKYILNILSQVLYIISSVFFFFFFFFFNFFFYILNFKKYFFFFIKNKNILNFFFKFFFIFFLIFFFFFLFVIKVLCNIGNFN